MNIYIKNKFISCLIVSILVDFRAVVLIYYS
jgi:hypothetical protein